MSCSLLAQKSFRYVLSWVEHRWIVGA